MNERLQYAVVVVVTVTVVVCVCLQRDPLAWRFALHQVVRGYEDEEEEEEDGDDDDEW